MFAPGTEHPLIDAFVNGDYQSVLNFAGNPTGGSLLQELDGLVVLSALYVGRFDVYMRHAEESLSRRSSTSFDALILRMLLGRQDLESLEEIIVDTDRSRIRFYSVNMAMALGQIPNPLRALIQIAQGSAVPETGWACRQLLRAALQIEPTLLTNVTNGEALFDLAIVAQAYLMSGRNDDAMRVANTVRRQLQGTTLEESEYGLAATSILLSVYASATMYDVALELAEKTLERSRRVLGAVHEDVATDLYNLGRLLIRAGRLRDAIRPLYDALKIRGELQDEAGSLRVMDTLSEALLRVGLLVDAGNLMEEIVRIGSERGIRDAWFASILQNLGVLRTFTRDYRMAERLLRHAVDLYRQGPVVDEGDALTTEANLARVLTFLGCHGEAIELLARVVEWRRDERGPDHSSVLLAVNALATSYYVAGHFDEAEKLYHEALTAALAEDNLKRQHAAENHAGLGETLRAVGRLDDAEYHLSEALRLDREYLGECHDFIAKGWQNISLLRAMRGDVKGAFDAAGEALRIEDQLDALLLAGLTDRERLAYVVESRQTFKIALSLYVQHAPTDTDLPAWLYSHLGKRKGAAGRASTLALGAVSDSAVATSLREVRLQIATFLMDVSDAAVTPDRKAELAFLMREKERLEREIGIQSGELLQKDFPDAQMVLDAIGSTHALVEYVRLPYFDFSAVAVPYAGRWKEERYGAFVLVGGVIQYMDLAPAHQVDELVRKFRQQVGNAGLNPLRQTGEVLRQTVFDPIRPLLRDIVRVSIAADGPLGLLPFDTLPEANQDYLIDSYEFSYLVTGLELCEAMPSVAPAPPAIFAAPNFELTSPIELPDFPAGPIDSLGATVTKCVQFKPLAGAEAEGKAIAKLLGVAPITGDAATKAAVLAVRSPYILHLATHGFYFDPPAVETPSESEIGVRSGGSRLGTLYTNHPFLRSGVALAGANAWLSGRRPPTDAGNGLLMAEEVLALDLRGCELVTLSACETGVGEVVTGEGVFGLRRALRLAGARCQILALWQVSDGAVAEMMPEFYRLLKDRVAPSRRSTALRQAQLKVKRQDKWKHPAKWGGFICDGNSEALSWLNGTVSSASSDITAVNVTKPPETV